MANRQRSVPGIIISAFFGLLVFFVIVMVFNYAAKSTENALIDMLAKFLNDNLLLIVLMSILFFVGDLFRAIIFPLNLPAPIFSSVASVFLVEFIFRILGLAEDLSGQHVFEVFRPFVPVIYVLVFFIVLISGYISIFGELFCEKDRRRHPRFERSEDSSEDRSWEDVGKEFRNMLYDAFHSARKDMEND